MTGGSGVGARAGEAGEDEGADEDGVACLDGGAGVGDLDGGVVYKLQPQSSAARVSMNLRWVIGSWWLQCQGNAETKLYTTVLFCGAQNNTV